VFGRDSSWFPLPEGDPRVPPAGSWKPTELRPEPTSSPDGTRGVVEISGNAFFLGMFVLAFLVALAWAGGFVVLVVVGLGSPGSGSFHRFSDRFIMGLCALLVAYAAVFFWYLFNGDGHRGIGIGILAGLVGCFLTWIIGFALVD
jgi:hypothetical protein